MRGILGRWSLFLIGMLVLPGCYQALSPAGQQRLDAALLAYNAGQDAQCVAAADAVLAENTKAPGAIEALYLRGMSRIRTNQISAATADLTDVLDRSEDPALQARAADALGELAFQAGEMDRAMALLKQAVQLAEPQKKPADHAHYRLGCIYQRAGKFKDADLHFQRVLFGFPGSELATRAKRRSGCKAWTVQLGSYHDSVLGRLAMRRLGKVAYPVRLERVLVSGKLVYLLQAGRWSRYDQAAVALPSLRKIKQDAFVSPTR